jgi:hypothetical protein
LTSRPCSPCFRPCRRPRLVLRRPGTSPNLTLPGIPPRRTRPRRIATSTPLV